MPFLLALLAILLIAGAEPVKADHTEFAYKWPFHSSTTGIVTTLPFQEEHACGSGSCTDAYDLVVSNAGIAAGAQGTVTQLVDMFDPETCDPLDGLGNFVTVQDNLLNHGLSSTYGHLSAVTISVPFAYQGDSLGIQGHTGLTSCNDHLHWVFTPSRPAFIDGLDAGNGDEDYGDISQTQVSHPSTNVVIGDLALDPTAGALVRVEYGVFNDWDTVGYVSSAGRGLPMHRYGAGWEQNFSNHDGQSGIYVPDRVEDDAFWVQPEFWDRYESVLGGATGFLRGLALDGSGSPGPARPLSHGVSGCT